MTSVRLPASGYDPTGAIRATIAGMTVKRERRSKWHRCEYQTLFSTAINLFYKKVTLNPWVIFEGQSTPPARNSFIRYDDILKKIIFTKTGMKKGFDYDFQAFFFDVD